MCVFVISGGQGATSDITNESENSRFRVFCFSNTFSFAYISFIITFLRFSFEFFILLSYLFHLITK